MTKNRNLYGKAQQLHNYILSLPDFPEVTEAVGSYNHMGATLTDAVLQAGVNYQRTVLPRVKQVLKDFPEVRTTRGFQALVEEQGADKILNWKEGAKPQRLRDLLQLLIKEQVETEPELLRWLQQEGHPAQLQAIKGVKTKTSNYLLILCGDPDAVAVDVNLRTYFQWAEISVQGDEELSAIVVATAQLRGVSPAALDHAIWRYVASKPKRN